MREEKVEKVNWCNLHLKYTIVTAVLLLLLAKLGAQPNGNNYVYGKVTDKAGAPLIGVNITIELSQGFTGTATQNDGSYKLESLNMGSYKLKASYLGYKPFEVMVTVSNKKPTLCNIKLEDENFDIKDVQVTAKSTTTRIREQSYEVEAIATKGLENSVSDAKTILNNISGVRIAEDGGMGSNSTFSLNGFSGSQVKFFLDGIPMDNFGSSLGIGDLPVNMIKHIEVYKGVVPVWLGNDALGGAVNITTHNTANYLDISYAIGSFNTHRTSLNGARSWKNGFTIRGNFFYNYSDNNYKVYVVKGNGDKEKKWYPRFHDRYKSATGKLEMGVTNKKYADNLLVGFILTGNNKQQQTGATMAKVYGGVLSESQSLISTLKYNKKNLFTQGLDISFYGAYTHNKSHAVDTLRGTSYDWSGEAIITPGSNNGEIGDRTFTIFNIKELTGQFNASYSLGNHNKVSFNYAISDYHRSVSDSLNPENEYNFFPKDMQKQTLGLSYQYKWAQHHTTTIFTKHYNLKAQTSKRYDQFLANERIEKLANKRNNIGYGLASTFFVVPQLQLKASYEKAYRMPTPLEMFGNGLFVNPNPDLKPESSDNLNFSLTLPKQLP